jgi:hypothetical protein
MLVHCRLITPRRADRLLDGGELAVEDARENNLLSNHFNLSTNGDSILRQHPEQWNKSDLQHRDRYESWDPSYPQTRTHLAGVVAAIAGTVYLIYMARTSAAHVVVAVV